MGARNASRFGPSGRVVASRRATGLHPAHHSSVVAAAPHRTTAGRVRDVTRMLVTGAVRSGKSDYAERLFERSEPVTYVTPGYPAGHDPEWAARVAAHQARRPSAWRTVETIDVAGALRATTGPVLVDCLGTWLTRTLDSWDAWQAPAATWAPLLDAASAELATAVAGHAADIVLVTNEVGWGLVAEYPSGRIFADNLGRLNQRVAAVCDRVVLLVAGRPLDLPAQPA